MIETPAALLAAGPLKVITSPPMVSTPLSWRCTPARILTNVDFPAPFSPRRACASPGYRVTDPFSSARTGPKLLVAPSRTSSGSNGACSVTLHRLRSCDGGHIVKPFTAWAGTLNPGDGDVKGQCPTCYRNALPRFSTADTGEYVESIQRRRPGRSEADER